MLPSNYQFKTTPYAHQLKAWELSKDEEYFALLMEQGTGKSKVIIDTASYLWGLGRINALVVVAPNGVHDNWAINEIPTHMPDFVMREVVVWHAEQTKAAEKMLNNLFKPGPHLRVLCMNVEGLSTKRAADFLTKFLKATDALLVVDESTTIKNPSALRTKALLKQRNLIKYRRIATGTPITKSPFDAFAPFTFLSEAVLGISSFVAFKSRYAQLLDASSPLIGRIMAKGARFMPQIVAQDPKGKPIYRNLPELSEKIKAHSFRVLKSDCLDLPEKIYQRRYYFMEPAQRRTYQEMRDKSKAEWKNAQTTALNKLTAMMRLQQIVSGYFPFEEGKPARRMFNTLSENPKIRALLEQVEEIDGQVIIFCRFVQEIQDVAEALKEHGTVGVYYGDVDSKTRSDLVESFQAGETRFFIANKTACRGLTLTAASAVLIYTNEFDLEIRLQLEDRPHRIGLKHNVTYIDMECLNTIDTGTINNLRAKKNVADIITGDPDIAWL